MLLEVLADDIANAGLAAPGETLFIHHMPADVNEGVLIRAPLDGVKVQYDLPGYYKTKIQVIVRARSTKAGDDLAKQISGLLTIGQRTINASALVDSEFELHFNFMRPNSWPIIYPRSDGNALEWSINFDCCFVLS